MQIGVGVVGFGSLKGKYVYTTSSSDELGLDGLDELHEVEGAAATVSDTGMATASYKAETVSTKGLMRFPISFSNVLFLDAVSKINSGVIFLKINGTCSIFSCNGGLCTALFLCFNGSILRYVTTKVL